MNILITSAGRRVSLVRAFQFEVKKIFPLAKVLTVDVNPIYSAACNVSDGFFHVKRLDDPEYVSDLLSICLEQKIKMIVPTLDTELLILAENRKLFEQNGIEVIVSDISFIKKCRDKRETNKFFEINGIDTPKKIDLSALEFPLFIKPYDGSLSADIHVIKSETELLPEFMLNPKFMFMEYLTKDENDEFTVDMYYGKDNRVKCIIPRKRIEVRGGEISKGSTEKNEIVNYLKIRLSHIPGAVGCLTLQLFRNKYDFSIKGIEINPRFGGGYPLSYFAGGNFPLFLITEYFFNETLVYKEDWIDKTIMLRYDAEIILSNG